MYGKKDSNAKFCKNAVDILDLDFVKSRIKTKFAERESKLAEVKLWKTISSLGAQRR